MKDLYEVDEMPELGIVPSKMYAWTIRPENHGEPLTAYTLDVVDTPTLGENDVLVLVMAAGMNYNGVWAALGKPLSPCSLHKDPFHIAGSDASGIVWQVGSAVKNDRNFKFRVGDEVVILAAHSCGKCSKCLSGQQVYCLKGKAWGYETNYGSFAQFTRVQYTQLLPKPKNMTWAESAGYLLCAATAWHMLFDFFPNVVKPGKNVLVYGGAGGVGSYVIQLTKLAGGNVVAVVSSDERGEYCMKLGANGFINRKKFDCWGRLPEVDSPGYMEYLLKVRKFRTAIKSILGKNAIPDIVVDFIGESTFPVSTYVVEFGGMVITCGATSGFLINFDASYLWMRQKRIQGSHFCSFEGIEQMQKVVTENKISCTVSKIHRWDELALAHQSLYEGQETYGNISIQVHAKEA